VVYISWLSAFWLNIRQLIKSETLKVRLNPIVRQSLMRLRIGASLGTWLPHRALLA